MRDTASTPLPSPDPARLQSQGILQFANIMPSDRQDIAIIGSGCRFPGGANSPSELWELLRNPRQLAEPIPPDRFSGQGYYHQSGQYHGHFNVKEAYFLAGEGAHRRFDATFFGMSPAEATCLDPQCRLLLETVYEALQDAGLKVEDLRGSDTAVYSGQMVADYDQLLMRDSDGSLGVYHASGTSHAILSNRISYFFDWHGPSMTIDTACSSSLVAIHQAVQQLRTGHSRVAIAAGANLIMDPKCFISLSSLNMLSPDGRSKMWDAEANGYARGEGIAAVVLKPLQAALEDGDVIECIIRETAFAQDGKTQGITSPNYAAQAQMIRDCYSRAGLDLNNPADRPQFFECHGTGTGAGDAAEAQAISTSFFPTESGRDLDSSQSYPQKLLVGSIKSIVGHTEGTAGVAGILKAALALREAIIPPNLLFNRLNPRIEPFYDHVRVATEAAPWPSLLPGSTRRASVNSFGFGGANVHAILESYTPSALQLPPRAVSKPVFSPFVFSAHSKLSLLTYLARFRDYIAEKGDSLCLRDLAYTLHSRRSCLQITTAIAASTVSELSAKISEKLQNAKDNPAQALGARLLQQPSMASGKLRVLGIFTGQGAQWPGMGADLLLTSEIASMVIQRMETRLSQLPSAHRPVWSLSEEIRKGPENSRLSEAQFSQPLCTAIQVLQVDMLRASGLELCGVVGHSSGEIAAAYATGYITAEDAICIAYYRGLYAGLASGRDGETGAMMAVGTSAEDAQELCDDPEIEGRVNVAAANSPASVTLSGDRHCLERLKVVFEDEKKFTRMLKVDTAYHSHHMFPCSEPYRRSLTELKLQIGNGRRAAWFSSVFGGQEMSTRQSSLQAAYWDDNMCRPVLFTQALTSALAAAGHLDAVIEVGPHLALKGPVLQTIQDGQPGNAIPYCCLFERGVPAVESVAVGLGYMWSMLGSHGLDLHHYDVFMSQDLTHKLVKGLPTYAWDQSEFWHESRYAEAMRCRPGPVHELLGHMTPDSQAQDMRWRHILRPSEIPWLMGHRLQDQIVFPGAGYAVTALEACAAMCRELGASATLIELADLEFGRALVFDGDDTNVEIIVSMADITRPSPSVIQADFRYHASDGKGDGSLNLLSTARVHVSIDVTTTEALPAGPAKPTNMTKVRAEDFYTASRDLGYQWDGPFAALGDLERKLGATVGCLNVVEPSNFLVHPAVLDAAFQAVLLAYSFPDDGQLYAIHVPRKIRRITVNTFLCEREAGRADPLRFAACHHPDTIKMIGNVDIYPSQHDIPNAMIQVEDLECVPFTRATAQDDKEEFSTVVWGVAHPDAAIASTESTNSVPSLHENIDDGLGTQASTITCTSVQAPLRVTLARIVEQLTHRNPRLDMLEIGAGEDSSARAVLDKIGPNFSTYTLSDIATQFLGSMTSWSESYSRKLIFKTLDINQDPAAQGFSPASYDVVITSLVLHMLPGEQPLRNIRGLLKPGGYLVALEHVPQTLPHELRAEMPQTRSRVGGDSAAFEPALVVQTWDRLLRNNGFSGCDSHSGGLESRESSKRELEGTHKLPIVWVSQSVDDRLEFLREPLSSQYSPVLQPKTLISNLIIVGGVKTETAVLARHIKDLVQQHCGQISVVTTLSEVRSFDVSPTSTVLSLADLDGPVFRDLDPSQWQGLKKIMMEAGAMVWVTQGRRAENPFANMIVGLVRSVIREVVNLNYQFLDFEKKDLPDAESVAESLLRFQAETLWRLENSSRAAVETEVVCNGNGQLLIPRLKISEEMNSRYNSLKRDVLTESSSHTQNVEIAASTSVSGYDLKQKSMSEHSSGGEQLEVSHSLLSAIAVTEFSNLFPVLGKSRASGRKVFALSLAHTTIVNIPDGLSTSLDLQPGTEAAFLSLFVRYCQAAVIFRGICPGSTVLVYQPSPGDSEVLAQEAQRLAVAVVFVTHSTGVKPRYREKWLTVHSLAPERTLSRLLPNGVSVFIDMSELGEHDQTRNRIHSLLPVHCRRESHANLFTNEAFVQNSEKSTEIPARLQECVARAASALSSGAASVETTFPVVLPASLAQASQRISPLSIIDWSPEQTFAVQVRPIDTQITFSSDKTYWFVGLSRGLGLALCEWMVRRGARYFVISSRKPEIDPVWLDEMCALGVVVKVSSCDVTVQGDVEGLFREICETMPAISGVVQGSMVLEDTAIRDMTLDNLLHGTMPKVQGSLYLNNCFQDNTLDFFVLFSSVVAVIGRPGQSNYSAANCFMASLAEQRRRRGLAASVIHIGPVYGIGYASRFEKAIYSRANFRSTALIPTSERDFYQLFAEAIVAGRPGSMSNSVEILNGVKRISPHDEDRPVWEMEPLMSHFILSSDGTSSGTGQGDSQIRVPLKTQLAEASDREQVFKIVRDAFLPKLHSIFQMEAAKVTQDTLISMRLDEMGIDSLIAVDIRSWLMKSLEVNIPVLKILSGVAIGELVMAASEAIPGRLLPRLEGSVEEGLDSSVSGLSGIPDSSGVSTDASAADIVSDSDEIVDDQKELGPIESVHGTTPGTQLQSLGVQRMYELSFSQEMFWFVWVFLQDKTSLNHTASARITGRLRIADFRKAVQFLGQRHEILRTAIVQHEGKPMQAVMANSTLDLEVRHINSVEQVREAVAELQDHHVYDVERGQMVRVMLLSKTSHEHYFVAGLHPLIADGTSFHSLIAGVEQIYTRSESMPEYQARQFPAYSEAQRKDFVTGKMADDLSFWKSEYAELPPPLPILKVSRAASRPDLTIYENLQATFTVTSKTKDRIQAVCRRCRATPFHFYLAAFRAMLLRFAPVGDGEDITIGIGDANRTEHDMMDIIGPLVNLLPLRLRTQTFVTFAQLLQETRDKVYAALEHSKIPFHALLTELGVSRSASYTSLFQAFVNYRQGLRRSTKWNTTDEVELHAIEIGVPKVAYDVTLEMVDYEDGDCVQTLVVRKDLYDQDQASMLVESYERLLEAFVDDPSLSLDQPNLFTPGNMEKAIAFSRGPAWPSQWPETLAHRVDEVSRAQPNAIAIRCGDDFKTYKDISAHANAIAADLRNVGIAAGSPVAVLLDRGFAWVSSILGIMRVGAVYLPLDMSLPWVRLAAIVNDCQPSAVLVDTDSKHLLHHLDRPEMRFIDISQSKQQSEEEDVISAAASGPAVILYTSGSSGTPKGIVLHHEGLRNWFEPIESLYNLRFGMETVLQQTTPSFDMSLTQIFTALCLGGTLYITSPKHRGDAHAICEIIEKQVVTYTCATPSEYGAWLRHGRASSLRGAYKWATAICAGEPMAESLVKQLDSVNSANLRLYNLYGPTETSITCTQVNVPLLDAGGRKAPITAGYPLPNYVVHVLDQQLRPVPPGVQGEIYIGGAGVGSGYLGNPELTAKRFIQNPLATAEHQAKGWSIMHHTGDLGRWQDDGALLVEGRTDTQVKLRGLRVDLEEIEHVMLSSSEGMLLEVAVSVHQVLSAKNEILVAHGVFARPDLVEQTSSLLLPRLRAILPQYMCPAAIVALEKMPTTTSGKLDRRILRDLPLPGDVSDGADGEARHDAALTDTEGRLKRIWEDLLGSSRGIHVDTDFFHVGGSSLLLLDLRRHVIDTFNVELFLVRMFESTTLRAMAQQIDNGMRELVEAAPPPSWEPPNWDLETALPPTLLDDNTRFQRASSHTHTLDNVSSSGKVVLTGNVDRLSRSLLERLVAESSVAHVHCIGVRNAQKSRDEMRSHSEKVSFYEGDLALPLLGLSEEDAAIVFGRAALVIHSSADRSYLKTYASLREANLQSTKDLAEMCVRYGDGGRYVPFHYVSTMAVGDVAATALKSDPSSVASSGSFKMEALSLANLPPLQNPAATHAAENTATAGAQQVSKAAYGYSATKWASEVFLERLHKFHPGWPIVIHRPSVIERAPDAAFDAASANFFDNVRHYSSLMHAVPAMPAGRGRTRASHMGGFNLVPLDQVSQAVFTAAMADLIRQGPLVDGAVDGVRFLHHTGGVELPLNDVRRWVPDEESAGVVEEVPPAEWNRRACELGMESDMAVLLEEMIGAEDHWTLL